jgi:riboflavin synthase
MFTGIVEEAGRVADFAPTPRGWSLRVAARAVLSGVALGDSIAVNGCCLTVAEFDAAGLRFDVLEETRRLTSFRTLVPGAAVNLEGSLRFDGKVGGHFVTGHIDSPGRVEVFEPRGADHYLRVGFPAEFGALVVPKGCIAIDGISLTIAECGAEYLAVWLIPHTLAVTNLRERRTGDTVNLEFDLLAKHVARLLQARGT